jgi:uncharacterized glyoxalase superfamily protein PhnB
MAEFQGLSLVAADVDATVAFYRLLGVDVDESTVWRTPSGAHHTTDVALPGSNAEVSVDSTALAAKYNLGYGDSAGSPTIFGFTVPSREAVDALFAELTAAGAASRQPPYDAFWGARYAIVADPDGRCRHHEPG